MPRSARVLLPGHLYHLTHRCHNGSYFFRFDNIRTEYRIRLWRAVRRFKIVMLNYCLTSNHTHLLLEIRRPEFVSAFMRHLEGVSASRYNRRNDRRGAFWSERFHATLIEGGRHFWNCMRYIDLNMVRAGVVRHPADWAWCGYQEIAGLRRRYRILDIAALVRLAELSEVEGFRVWYDLELDQTLKSCSNGREPHWSESIAVGSEGFVRRIGVLATGRKKLDIRKWLEGTWYVREREAGYQSKRTSGGRFQRAWDSALDQENALEN